jgi:hypothetical protein
LHRPRADSPVPRNRALSLSLSLSLSRIGPSPLCAGVSIETILIPGGKGKLSQWRK